MTLAGDLRGMADAHCGGDLDQLADVINESLRSVSEELPKLDSSHPIFQQDVDVIPDDHAIPIDETERALFRAKANKATWPDGIPPWLLRDFCHIISRPFAAIFNSSLREGYVPSMWKAADVIPLPKTRPPIVR